MDQRKNRPPDVLVGFDILRLGSKSVIGLPRPRCVVARSVAFRFARVLRSRPSTDGVALLAQCKALKLHGILAKRAGSKYRAGVRTGECMLNRPLFNRRNPLPSERVRVFMSNNDFSQFDGAPDSLKLHVIAMLKAGKPWGSYRLGRAVHDGLVESIRVNELYVASHQRILDAYDATPEKDLLPEFESDRKAHHDAVEAVIVRAQRALDAERRALEALERLGEGPESA